MMRISEETLTPSEIDLLWKSGVKRTLACCIKHSPFYRSFLRRSGFKLGDFKGLESLHLIPTTTKEDVSRCNPDFISVPRAQIAEIVTTSGSTGRPVSYPLTSSDLDRLALNEYYSFLSAGLRPKDTVLLAVTLDRTFIAGLAYYLGLRMLGCTVVRVGPSSAAMLIETAKDFRATAVVSVPSFLRKVTDYALENKIDLRQLHVGKFICIGEPIRDSKLRLFSPLKEMGRKWGASFISTYGITELAISFCECHKGQGGHVHPSLLYFEILDDVGNPVPDGEVGELTATTIGVEGFPLIRYRTGDLTFKISSRCSCGLHTPRIGPIVGRKNQMLKLKGTTVYPSAVKMILDEVDLVEDYALVATAETPLSDTLEIIAAVRGDQGEASRCILSQLQGRLRVTPKLTITSSETVIRLKNGENLRKKPFFIDRRKL